MMNFKKQKNKIGALLILIGIVISQSISAANILKIGTYSVQPNTSFVVQLEVVNTDPFVAFQADIPIPAGYSYVENSAQYNTARISGHSLSATLQSGNVIRLVGYSANNTSFTGNSGMIVSFSLKSGTVPGDFALVLKDGILSDNQTKNVLTSAENGKVTVLCSNIQMFVTELDYGKVALGTVAQKTVLISNSGNRDLLVNELTFNDPQFSTSDPTSFTIPSGGNKSITVKFTPLKKGIINKQIQIKSNDPDQAETNISLNAIAFAVNELHSGNIIGASSSNGKLEFTINNMEDFTGFQFDLSLPKPMTFVTGSAQLFRIQDHVVGVSQINSQTLRFASFSPTNKSFTGTIGKILSLDFALNGIAGWYPLNISNVIISDASGENILSASMGGSLQITSPDINASADLNFGDISILSKGSLNHRIYNRGQETLTVSQLLFSSDYFTSKQIIPQSISPNSYLDIPIEFACPKKELVKGTLKIVSNDPDENPFTINLSAKAFAPNYLQISQQTMWLQETKMLPVEITNEESFVAFQFDLKYPLGLTPVLSGILLSDRKTDHIVASTLPGNNVLRIVAYSSSMQPFSGKEGAVVSIPFKAEATILPGSYTLELSNGLISNQSSENILYSMQNGILKVQSPNQAPLAIAGVDQIVNEGSAVSLNGSASSDPDGNPLTYQWTAPVGITLSSTTAAKPTFIAPEVKMDSVLVFTLVVNDGIIDSQPSYVNITLKDVIKTGVEYSKQNELKIFPNPSNGIFKMTGLSPNKKELIEIYTIDGNLIQQKISNAAMEIIDISNQSSGSFLIVVKGQTFTIVKN